VFSDSVGLHDTIPGARDLVEIAGGKLFFPHERAAEPDPHLRRHWTTADRDCPGASRY
jgi:hypothetical protein